ncbi:MAG TPA: hypothetical protein VN778_00460 [Verrucomicrobiae bacterium]|nr:hypothetical protein [Verrucomicrobiae bacterium]
MSHLSNFGRTNLRLTIVAGLAFFAILVLATVANAEGGVTRGNVEMQYGYNGVLHRIVNTTTVYTGHIWKKSSQDGRLVTTKSGIYLKLVKGEKVVQAGIYYGTISTPTYKDFPWSGRGTVPYFKQLKAKDGKIYKIKLSSVFVLVHEAGRPLPSLTGGK